ncbi:hypothetical protein C8T65DRAFT_693456 [Cerioporus squamosus]|nr:hypothetical protein C8T65DRAFT_693456 [Cerioporus squamosus]
MRRVRERILGGYCHAGRQMAPSYIRAPLACARTGVLFSPSSPIPLPSPPRRLTLPHLSLILVNRCWTSRPGYPIGVPEFSYARQRWVRECSAEGNQGCRPFRGPRDLAPRYAPIAVQSGIRLNSQQCRGPTATQWMSVQERAPGTPLAISMILLPHGVWQELPYSYLLSAMDDRTREADMRLTEVCTPHRGRKVIRRLGRYPVVE